MLNLVEIKTNLMMAAANAHPFGHFWLVAAHALNGWVKDKTVEVAYRAFEVTAALHEPLMSSETLLKAANAAHSKKRKIELEEQINDLKRNCVDDWFLLCVCQFVRTLHSFQSHKVFFCGISTIIESINSWSPAKVNIRSVRLAK